MEVAQGLEAIHELGYIHMDIKCDNIMLTEDKEVRIIDFGGAIKEGKTAGPCTEGYYAPEVAKCAKLYGSADVYSLGVVILQLLMKSQDVLGTEKANKGRHIIKRAEEMRTVVHTQLRTDAKYRDDVAIEMRRLGLDCVKVTAKQRPTPKDVKEKVSRFIRNMEI